MNTTTLKKHWGKHLKGTPMDYLTLKIETTQTAQELATFNINSEVYGFNVNMDNYPIMTVDLSKERASVQNKVQRDLVILHERATALKARTGIRVGDYIHCKDGSLKRFTIDNGDNLQAYVNGSFHIFASGGLSYSGTCGYGIPKANIQETKEVKEGSVWFFSDNYAGGGRGIYGLIEFKVFKEI